MEGQNTGASPKSTSYSGETKALYAVLSYEVIGGSGRKPPSERQTMKANPYTSNVSTVIEMFTDAAAGESTQANRLVTVELDNGNVGLVAYGEKILAEYDEAEGRVTAYLGHKTGGGKTITRWLNAVTDEAAARRSITFSDDAPWFAPPNADAAQYIGAYVNFNDKSAVEQAATETVIDSLRHLDKFL